MNDSSKVTPLESPDPSFLASVEYSSNFKTLIVLCCFLISYVLSFLSLHTCKFKFVLVSTGRGPATLRLKPASAEMVIEDSTVKPLAESTRDTVDSASTGVNAVPLHSAIRLPVYVFALKKKGKTYQINFIVLV